MASRRGLFLDENSIDHFVPTMLLGNRQEVGKCGWMNFGGIAHATEF